MTNKTRISPQKQAILDRINSLGDDEHSQLEKEELQNRLEWSDDTPQRGLWSVAREWLIGKATPAAVLVTASTFILITTFTGSDLPEFEQPKPDILATISGDAKYKETDSQYWLDRGSITIDDNNDTESVSIETSDRILTTALSTHFKVEKTDTETSVEVYRGVVTVNVLSDECPTQILNMIRNRWSRKAGDTGCGEFDADPSESIRASIEELRSFDEQLGKTCTGRCVDLVAISFALGTSAEKTPERKNDLEKQYQLDIEQRMAQLAQVNSQISVQDTQLEVVELAGAIKCGTGYKYKVLVKTDGKVEFTSLTINDNGPHDRKDEIRKCLKIGLSGLTVKNLPASDMEVSLVP